MLAPEWPYGEAHRLYEDVDSLNANMDRMDVLAALRLIDTMNRRLVKIASDVVEIAAKESALTQKQVAEALGVTPATLRGWRG